MDIGNSERRHDANHKAAIPDEVEALPNAHDRISAQTANHGQSWAFRGIGFVS